jgi:hypothetical protein
VNGTLNYTGGGSASSPDVEMEDELLEDLNAFFMVNAEARQGRWLAFTDFIYLNFSGVASHVTSVDFGSGRTPVAAGLNAQTTSSLSGVAWTLLGGYQFQHRWVDLDLLGGFRYFGLEASSDWNLTATVSGPGAGQVLPRTGTVSDDVNLWDALVGLKGRVRAGESRWFLPYYADVGAGGSRLTWQTWGGIGWTALPWLEIDLTYRYVYYDTGARRLIQDLAFRGPSASLAFRF